MFSNLFERLVSTRSSARPARPARSRRLNLESLESREVPATVYAIAPGNQLLRFDSATPTTIQSTRAITGLGANQTVRGIDFRPRTGQLIISTVTTGSANNSVVTTYRLDPSTAAAALIGATAPLAGAGDVPTGYDFNPTVDRIRYVNVNDENARLNPNNGTLAGDDTNLTATAAVIAVAYDRNFDRQVNAGDVGPLPTTLYGIDRATGMLVTQGGINGAGPGGANGGVITPVGPLGVTLSATRDGGFDVMDSTDNGQGGGAFLGTGFAALTTADGVTRLYRINLANGAATLVGAVGDGTLEIYGIAVAPDSALVVGSGAGANADVRRLEPTTGAVLTSVSAPFPGFTGGTRVAAGDVNRDGIPDLIVSAVAPQGHVKAFDGATGEAFDSAIGSFFAFEGFNGTVNVASGDVNRDGFDDVLVVANGPNGHVKAFSGRDGSLLASFFAYQGFMGNVTIAAADFNNDGAVEIVTAAAANGHVKVFNADGTPFSTGFVNSFLAYDGFGGDVFVAAGDLNGDGIADLITASGAGSLGHVKAFSGTNGSQIASFIATPVTFGVAPPVQLTTIASVSVADVNADGRYEIVATPSAGVQARVTAFDLTGAVVGTVTGFDNFQGGLTAAGQRF